MCLRRLDYTACVYLLSRETPDSSSFFQQTCHSFLMEVLAWLQAPENKENININIISALASS